MKSALLFIGSLIVLSVLVVVIIAANPLIGLLVGMFIGYILELLTGDYVVQAINSVGISGVNDGDLPKMFGLLGVVVALFIMADAVSTNKERKGDD